MECKEALSVWALASGSSGNTTLVSAGEAHLLIDAGLPVRALTAHLKRCGVHENALRGILITHEHSDHTSAAASLARKFKVPIYANRATLEAVAQRTKTDFPTVELETGGEVRIGGVVVRSFPVPHDAAEPVGYTLGFAGARVTYCTDMGCPTPEIAEALRGANFIVIEANHNVRMLQSGPYSADMKRRIISDCGHLSNEQCARLIVNRLEADGPATIWLAHLSRVNNSRTLAKSDVTEHILQHTSVMFHLDIPLRDQPSLRWRPGAASLQQTLF